ncbi:hypothetical protein NB703_002112 [Pantoea ananatis]|uniref:Uncharacterized protein n=1 Tax=Pantoea ananas TaxID=553 RepID=A0AAJ1CYL1_PANAN|nr:hypothetical protein [Pantoea ananatis]
MFNMVNFPLERERSEDYDERKSSENGAVT